MQVAFRLGTELTVATFIGAILGYGVDRFFGVRPWGLAVGVILGGAAGSLNVYRAAMSLTIEDENTEDKDTESNKTTKVTNKKK